MPPLDHGNDLTWQAILTSASWVLTGVLLLIALRLGARERTAAHATGRKSVTAWCTVATASFAAYVSAPPAQAAPDPQVEYMYNVTVRRHYNWPAGNDALGYGHGICDKVAAGKPYPAVLGEVKNDVTPNDEFAANYLVSYAVNLLCPDQIWQLRNSAAGYQPPPAG